MLCVANFNNYSGRESPVSNINKMPADYSSYLLSASPPGFDLAYTLRDRYDPRNVKARRPHSPSLFNRQPYSRDSPVSFTCSEEYEHVTEGFASLIVGEFQSAKSNSLPIGYTKYGNDPHVTNNKNSNNNVDNKLTKKSVSFADELGRDLVEIRLMYETPDEPPTFVLPAGVLDYDDEAGITDSPPLALNFSQPASNYMEFRQKLEHRFVSLENVIVREYNLLGTVKVKNIAFEKKVTVRYTCDSWETQCDVDASYVSNARGMAPPTSKASPYDTFSFQLNIPPTFDPTKKIQFSITYETNGQQFWDSNDGNNYEVVSASYKSPPVVKTSDNGVFDLQHDDKWSEFSNWSLVDNSIPYW